MLQVCQKTKLNWQLTIGLGVTTINWEIFLNEKRDKQDRWDNIEWTQQTDWSELAVKNYPKDNNNRVKHKYRVHCNPTDYYRIKRGINFKAVSYNVRGINSITMRDQLTKWLTDRNVDVALP